MRWIDVRVPIADPGGTHTLYVVYRARSDNASPLKLNWIEFEGQGVTDTAGAPALESTLLPLHDH